MQKGRTDCACIESSERWEQLLLLVWSRAAKRLRVGARRPELTMTGFVWSGGKETARVRYSRLNVSWYRSLYIIETINVIDCY